MKPFVFQRKSRSLLRVQRRPPFKCGKVRRVPILPLSWGVTLIRFQMM